MPIETPASFSPLALALRTSRSLLDGERSRRGADGERLPWTLSPDALLGLAYLTMRIDGERGHAPCAYPPPMASEGDDAWRRYISLVQRWQLERDGHLTGFFGSDDELLAASDAGLVATHAAVFVRRAGRLRFTTPGRSRVVQAIGDDPLGERFDRSLSAPRIDEVLTAIDGQRGARAAWTARVRLERRGLDAATRSGLSIGIDTLPRLAIASLIERGQASVVEVEESFAEGLITDGERYHKVIDVWSDVCEQSRTVARRQLTRQSGSAFDGAHALALLGEEEPRRTRTSVQLLAIRMTERLSGELREKPMLENLRGGLGSHAYFVTAMEARQARLMDSRNERWLASLRDVVQASIGDVRVVAGDCGSVRPLWALLGWRDGSDRPTAERVTGRTLAGSLRWHGGGEEGSVIDRAQRDRWSSGGLFRVPVRSVVTCEARGGVCSACLGRDDVWRPEVGDPVGRWATESIVAAGRELVSRRRPVQIIAGAIGRLGIDAWSDALVAIEQQDESSIATVAPGVRVVLDGSVVVRLLDRQGEEVQREPLQRGDVLRVDDGDFVRQGTSLAAREPLHRGIPLLAEVTGTVRWCDVIVREEVDPTHGLASFVVVRAAADPWPPRLVIEHEGREAQVCWLDDGAVMHCKDGDPVVRGSHLASLAGDPHAHRDDWSLDEAGELWALLRGRAPSEEAVLSEVAGVVALESEEVTERGRRFRRTLAVVVTPLDAQGRPVDALAHRHEMPAYRLVQVHDGDVVRAGDPLCHGAISPGQMLRFQGHTEAGGWMVERVLQLFARYGAKPRSAHIELLIRAMMVGRIIDPADGCWSLDEVVEWPEFFAHNRALEDAGKRPACAEPVVRNLARVGQSRRPPDRIA